jgi:hypothetical protein
MQDRPPANGAILVIMRTQPLSQPSPGHFISPSGGGGKEGIRIEFPEVRGSFNP